MAARQLCLRCSARTGGVSDIKVELVSGSGDSRNPPWAWCALECSRREAVTMMSPFDFVAVDVAPFES